METILKIYFSINFFIAGYNYAESVNWATKKSEKIQAYLLVPFSVFFGLALIILTALFIPVKKCWDYFNGYLQIAFWFDLYLRKKYNNMEVEMLQKLNRIAYLKKTTNSIRDKLYRKGVKLINERNQYTYVHEDAVF